MTDRTWRDAKLPQWVRDSIAEELQRDALRAALAWPTEKRPVAAPFCWGGYDRLKGEAVSGTYWQGSYASHSSPSARRIEITDDVRRFVVDGRPHQNVVRGPLYYSARDALLALLWDECTAAAKRLQAISDKIKDTGQ